MESNFAKTKVKWHVIADVGMPPKELRFIDSQVERMFLVRGEWSIFTSFLFNDGSGFSADQDDTPQAWAIIEGF